MNRKTADDTNFNFRCRKTDLEAFKRAAESEGFGGNVSAWLKYHLRRQAIPDTRDRRNAK